MAINYDRVVGNIERMRPGVNIAKEAVGSDPPSGFGLSEVELEFLRLIATNSKFSITPQKMLLSNQRPMNPHGPLSIATISTSLLFRAPVPPNLTATAPVTGVVSNHFKPISRSSNRYRLFTLENDLSLNDMKSFLATAILNTGKALRAFEEKELKELPGEDGCRLIVVNEFGFPFPLEEEEREAFLAELEREMVQDLEMQGFWSSCYLVFGTYHCHSEMKNSAVISLPYVPDLDGPYRDATEAQKAEEFRGNIIGNPLEEEGAGRFNFTQDKIVAAERIGERLVPRNTVDWTYYDTDMGRIGVLICFDALDPRMLLRLALLRLRDTNTDVTEFSAVIVPCFSRDDHVLESCRLLSSVMDTLVVYVNVQYAEKGANDFEVPTPDEPRPTSQAYFYRGRLISEGMGDPDIVSRDFEEATPVDMAKNLWYTTRFCHLRRWGLHERNLAKTSFSPLFLQIFDPQRRFKPSDSPEKKAASG